MEQKGVTINPFDVFENFSRLFGKDVAVRIADIVHWSAVIGIGFYAIFALMIVRQVGLMTRFLGTNLSPWIKTFAWIYVFYTVFVLLVIIGVV